MPTGHLLAVAYVWRVEYFVQDAVADRVFDVRLGLLHAFGEVAFVCFIEVSFDSLGFNHTRVSLELSVAEIGEFGVVKFQSFGLADVGVVSYEPLLHSNRLF